MGPSTSLALLHTLMTRTFPLWPCCVILPVLSSIITIALTLPLIWSSVPSICSDFFLFPSLFHTPYALISKGSTEVVSSWPLPDQMGQ